MRFLMDEVPLQVRAGHIRSLVDEVPLYRLLMVEVPLYRCEQAT